MNQPDWLGQYQTYQQLFGSGGKATVPFSGKAGAPQPPRRQRPPQVEEPTQTERLPIKTVEDLDLELASRTDMNKPKRKPTMRGTKDDPRSKERQTAQNGRSPAPDDFPAWMAKYAELARANSTAKSLAPAPPVVTPPKAKPKVKPRPMELTDQQRYPWAFGLDPREQPASPARGFQQI